jgi:hypothetical protein
MSARSWSRATRAPPAPIDAGDHLGRVARPAARDLVVDRTDGRSADLVEHLEHGGPLAAPEVEHAEVLPAAAALAARTCARAMSSTPT